MVPVAVVCVRALKMPRKLGASIRTASERHTALRLLGTKNWWRRGNYALDQHTDCGSERGLGPVERHLCAVARRCGLAICLSRHLERKGAVLVAIDGLMVAAAVPGPGTLADGGLVIFLVISYRTRIVKRASVCGRSPATHGL
jgi:hypothetical protein